MCRFHQMLREDDGALKLPPMRKSRSRYNDGYGRMSRASPNLLRKDDEIITEATSVREFRCHHSRKCCGRMYVLSSMLRTNESYTHSSFPTHRTFFELLISDVRAIPSKIDNHIRLPCMCNVGLRKYVNTFVTYIASANTNIRVWSLGFRV
jgi:hypothetical protein